MQKLESELTTVHEKEMAEIREKINSILSAAGHGGAVELAAAATRIDSKFNDVSQQIIDNCSKFGQGAENLNSHRGTAKLYVIYLFHYDHTREHSKKEHTGTYTRKKGNYKVKKVKLPK